jgi:amino acid adenylation domain-containing protein
MNRPQQTALKKEKNVFEDSVLFWKQQLDVDTPFLQLPVDFPRSPTTSYRASHAFFSLSTSCFDALKQLSNQLDISLFTILLAAYNTLLFRYTRQEDIIIGFPTIENDLDEKVKFTDTLSKTKLFRTDLSGNPCFNELLRRVQQVVLAANKHKDVPYETLEEAKKLEFGINYTGLYNVIFSHRNVAFEDNELNERALNNNAPENLRAAVDLTLSVKETLLGLKGVWTYNSELFEPATIKRIANHFEVLLNSIVLNPQQTISQLQLLTDAEHHQLTVEWNSSKIDYFENKCIHELFEEQVRKTPGATAVVFEKRKLTYAELNERSNQLAHYLCSRGVKQETLIPICIGRSLEMIIAILGILKAGAAYVPIDPNYPLERLTYLLDDIKASLVICNKESKNQLKAFENIELVELTNEGSFLKNQATDNLNINLSSNSLAYIIYTSGSTGKPKGVMIEHRSLSDHCYGVIEGAGLKTCKSFALFSPLVFDAGHSIIHSSFLLGASLHVLSEELIVNSEKIINYFNENSIDCIKIVPSLWLSYANLQKMIIGKKVIIFGGEAFPLSILNYLKKINYRGNVYNHYGPTEITIGKCIYKVDINKTYITVPIGKPFSNTQLYVLDDQFQLTPIGIGGELYVAGDGLARGYLNKPNLTTEKFIPNPFNTDSSSCRMYKTGDKVRWLSDGNIEYLGRSDEQVKIQGHRIELGEIEDALLQSEIVCQAVVLAKADKKGNKRLVAYIVPAKPFNKESITNFLRKKLPEYMVPVTFVELENLPLTGNGKINKRELENLVEIDRVYIGPQNDTEAKLAVIWQDVLNIESISIDDNFFELGGNSIQAAVLFAKIKRKFHKDYLLATIFKAPTVRQLALTLNTTSKELLFSSPVIPIQPNGSKTPLFCMHAGHGDILFYGNLSLRLGLDQPFYGVQAKGINGIEYPSSQMEQMAEYYIKEIRKVQPEGPYYLGGYCLGAQIAFEMTQQLTQRGQKVALLANFNGISPTYHRLPDFIKNEINRNSKEAFTNNTRPNLHNNIKHRLQKTALNPLRKAFFKSRKSFYKLMYKIVELIFKLCLYYKQKAPGIIARLHVGRSLYLLGLQYKPKAYPGTMIIFRSPGIYKDPCLGWKGIVKGKIKTFDIQGSHKTRRDIINEPFVQNLAKELKNFLDN